MVPARTPGADLGARAVGPGGAAGGRDSYVQTESASPDLSGLKSQGGRQGPRLSRGAAPWSRLAWYESLRRRFSPVATVAAVATPWALSFLPCCPLPSLLQGGPQIKAPALPLPKPGSMEHCVCSTQN